MDSDEKKRSQRMVVCLVADESVADHLPSTLRSLQIGLIDELIDLLLVVPEDDRCQTLAAGPTQVVTYKHHVWPLAGMARKRISALVAERAQALKPPTPMLVHSLTANSRPLAGEIATVSEGPLIQSLWSAADASASHLTSPMTGVAALLAPCDAIAQAIRPRLPADRAVEVVPLGVTCNAQPAVFKDAERAPTLVLAGELYEDAGIEAVLRAAKRAMQRHPNLLVFLFGRGPGEAGLRHVVAGLDIDQQVIFTGRLEYLRTALEAADVYCLPGAAAPHREEMIHAMAAGLAIIAPHRSPYDGLEDEKNALLFSESDEDALATALLRLLDDRETAHRLGAEAQATARQLYSVPRMIEGHARIYRRLDRRERTFTLAGGRVD